VIALAVPMLDMAYFAELTRIVVEAAERLDYTVLVDQTDGLREREEVVARGVRSHLIDGLILSPVAMDQGELSQVRDETPLVLLGEKFGAGPLDHIAVDNVAAAAAATGHLLGLGRSRVAAIGYQAGSAAKSGVAAVRRAGYEQALAAHGHRPDARLAQEVAGYRRADGAAAMARLLEDAPEVDAVFCFNDELALGAMRALAERGIRVPDDVAVIGFDDIEDGRFSTPTLSTVRPDKPAIADAAVRVLHERLSDVPSEPHEIIVGFELVVRESTEGPSRAPRRR
jgi:DNA-binding LacI/PurR family transcriptional regulator